MNDFEYFLLGAGFILFIKILISVITVITKNTKEKNGNS